MKYAIYGTGGFAREIIYYLELSVKSLLPDSAKIDIVFVDDDVKMVGKMIKGVETISFDMLCSSRHSDRKLLIGVADWKIRRAIVEKCRKFNFTFVNMIDVNSRVMSEIRDNTGVILCPFTTITSNVKIGTHFHSNIYSYVGHDCVIGDFVTFAPRVSCNGNVHIGNNVYIGTGVKLIQGTSAQPLRIGDNSIVGMGMIVRKSVPDNTKIFGTSGKIISKSIET